jgi:hypothetical protein
LWAQEVYVLTGVVQDTKGENLPYCNVVATEKIDSTVVFGTVSDATGVFKINIPKGTYNFKIMYLGYENYQQELTIQENMNIGTITLNPSAIELNEITIKPDMIRRKADGYVFMPGNSTITQGRNTSELLNYLPEIWVNRSNKNISIHNKKGTKVMVNDRLLPMSGEELYNYLETINAEDIKSIEVISETGAEHDANSSGGILKIKLKSPEIQGFKATTTLVSGFQDETGITSFSPNFNLEYQKNKFSVYSNIRYKKNKFYQKNDEITLFYNDTQREMSNLFDGISNTENVTGKIGMLYQLSDKQSVGMDFDLMDTETNNNNISNSIINTIHSSTKGYVQSLSQQNRDRYTLSLNYRRKLDTQGSSLLIIGDYMRNNRKLNENDSITDTLLGEFVLPSIDERSRLTSSKTNYYTFKTDINQYLSENLTLTAGIKYAYTNMNTRLDYYDEINDSWVVNQELQDHYLYREGVAAGYIMAKTNFGRFQINGGIRVENTDLKPYSYIKSDENMNQNYTDFFPSLSFNYVLNPQKNHNLSMGYNRSIQRPSFNELNPYQLPLNHYTFVVGNPDLRPSYTNSIHITGVLYNKYSLSIGCNKTAGAVDQIILQDPENSDVLIYQFANIDKVSGYFISLNMPYNITKWWRSSLDLVWFYSKNELKNYVFEGDLYQGRINNFFSLSRNWNFELNYMYNSGGVSSIWHFKPHNSLDMSVKKNFLKNKLTATFTITNLLDDGGATMNASSDQPGFIFKTFHQRNGNMMRTYNLSIRYNFKFGKDIKVNQVTRGNQEESAR